VEWIGKNGGWRKNLLIVTGDHETGFPAGPAADSLWASSKLKKRCEALSLENRGKGHVPGIVWRTSGHTNALIPLFARGEGSGLLKEAAKVEDPVRGDVLDNTELGKTLFDLTPVKSGASR
jgi:alkaline phosphatase